MARWPRMNLRLLSSWGKVCRRTCLLKTSARRCQVEASWHENQQHTRFFTMRSSAELHVAVGGRVSWRLPVSGGTPRSGVWVDRVKGEDEESENFRVRCDRFRESDLIVSDQCFQAVVQTGPYRNEETGSGRTCRLQTHLSVFQRTAIKHFFLVNTGKNIFLFFI